MCRYQKDYLLGKFISVGLGPKQAIGYWLLRLMLIELYVADAKMMGVLYGFSQL